VASFPAKSLAETKQELLKATAAAGEAAADAEALRRQIEAVEGEVGHVGVVVGASFFITAESFTPPA